MRKARWLIGGRFRGLPPSCFARHLPPGGRLWVGCNHTATNNPCRDRRPRLSETSPVSPISREAKRLPYGLTTSLVGDDVLGVPKYHSFHRYRGLQKIPFARRGDSRRLRHIARNIARFTDIAGEHSSPLRKRITSRLLRGVAKRRERNE